MASESAVGGWTPGGGSSLRPLANTTPAPPRKQDAAVSTPVRFPPRSPLPPFPPAPHPTCPFLASFPLLELLASLPLALALPPLTQPPYYVPAAADDPTSNRYPHTSMHSGDSDGCGDRVRAAAEWIDNRICCGCEGTQRTNELCSYVCVACVGGCLGACSRAC